METKEKTTPPVPPAGTFTYGDANPHVIEREPCGTCPCGGRMELITERTGRMVVIFWNGADFEDDQFALEEEYPQENMYQNCKRCGFEVSV